MNRNSNPVLMTGDGLNVTIHWGKLHEIGNLTLKIKR